MDYKSACKILNLKQKFDIKTLKRHYYKAALLYHPDKNKEPDAEIKFQETNAAYEYLQKYLNVVVEDTSSNYFTIIKKCVSNLFPTVPWNDIFIDSTLNGIITNCKKASLKIFSDINKDKAFEVYTFLSENKEIFDVSEDTLKEMYQILQKKLNEDYIIILNPTIEDLLDDKIYKLNIYNHEYLVPLWNYEVCFDISGADLIVKSIPDLDDYITIDNNNNIICKFQGKIQDVLNKKKITIKLGSKFFTIEGEKLSIKPEQTFVFRNKGLLKIDEEDLYSTTERGNIYVDIKLI
jgi:hypothetical protein